MHVCTNMGFITPTPGRTNMKLVMINHFKRHMGVCEVIKETFSFNLHFLAEESSGF